LNYTWRITKLGLRDELNLDDILLENAVVQVQWKRIAEDTDGVSASYLGSTALDLSNVSLADFTAINSVNKQQVVAWLEESLSDTAITRINDILIKKIERNRVRFIKPSWG